MFIAQDWARPDRFYPVPVYAGTDPRSIVQNSRDPLVSCYSLQDPARPLEDQLSESRPWHLEPSGHLSAADPHIDADTASSLQALRGAGGRPPTDAVRLPRTITVHDLQAARHGVDLARAWTFSPRNTNRDYSQYEHARTRLVAVTRTAYEQARIATTTVRRVTGLTRPQVAPLPHRSHGPARQPPARAAGIGY